MAEIWPDEGLDQVLAFFPRANLALPANTWLSVFFSWSASTVGTNTDTRANYLEPTGAGTGGYIRQTISSSSWGSVAAATGGRKMTAGQVTFATATAHWANGSLDTVNGFTVANSASTAAGSLYFAANFDDTTGVNIQSNDVIKVTPTIQYNQ